MDNNNINPTPADSEENSGISLEKAEESTAQSLSPEYNQSSDTQPAFEYQPPVVEAPEPPTVNEIPSQPAQQQPQYQQPQYQQPQYQQPQYQHSSRSISSRSISSRSISSRNQHRRRQLTNSLIINMRRLIPRLFLSRTPQTDLR